MLTNKEVRTMFEGMFREWFASDTVGYNGLEEQQDVILAFQQISRNIISFQLPAV